MTPLPFLRRQRWPLVVFGVCTLVVWLALQRHQAQALRLQRAELQSVATDQAQRIESQLQRLLSSTYLLAALVQKDQGQVRHFTPLAREILPYFPGVTALSLAPGGVIRYTEPLETNSGSLGLNLLTDPIHGADARQARDQGRLTLSGPQPLVQGGLGAIGRLPIVLNDDHGGAQFWGFATAVVRFPDALRTTGLPQLVDQGLSYHLWRHEPNGTGRLTIDASPDYLATHQLTNPVEKTLQVPNTEWVLAIAPQGGWRAPMPWAWLFTGLAAAALLAFLTHLLLRLRRQRQHLRDEVQEQTRDIRDAQARLQATLNAIPDLLFEIDLDGRLHLVHAQDPQLLYVPSDDIGERSIFDLLPASVVEVARAAMDEALNEGRSFGKRYQLDLPDGPHWFELSVSRKNVQGLDTPRFVVLARDITRRMEAETRNRLISHFFEGSGEGFVITDARHRIIQINPAFTRITGYSLEDIVGQTPAILSSGLHDAQFYKRMWESIEAEGRWEGEIWNRRRSGENYPEWLSITRVPDAQGSAAYYIAIFSDTSLRKRHEATIQQLAYYDPLTGLANRSLLKDRVEHDLSQARRAREPLALLFIDLDHFKHINDSLGHQVGDEVLRQVGQRLRSLVRARDTVSRLGGDEFVAVLPGTDAIGAAHVSENLLERLGQAYEVQGHELTVTPSIGLALFPDDGSDFDTLYRCADTAMYRAKTEGRNGYSFFTLEMQTHSTRRLRLENALRRALEREQLHLVYQPQLDLQTGQVVGVEALLRWEHPELGAVSPAEFIPIAESSRLILSIGDWVLRTAAHQLAAWRAQGLPPMVMAVNLSALQFQQAELPAQVAELLHQTGLPADSLELELTETLAMDNPQGAIATMDALRHRGVLLSLDDFGTGYSSLNHLKRFQVYKLKIDQSFVRDVLNDPDDASIVRAIVQMARSLGLRTIAEGVETQAQRDFLHREGCDEIQGYFLARPLPPAGLSDWLRQRLSPRG